jgi:tetratricopeptide (TPR) repeat protein
MDKPDSAISFLKDAVQQFPGSADLKINLAQAYFNKKQTDEALKINEAVLSADPASIDALLQRSDLLEEKKDTAAVIQTLERARAIAGEDKEVVYRLAFQYAQSGNKKVFSLCDSLIRADSAEKHGEPYYFKGIYFNTINDKVSAVAQLNDAILNDYTFLDAYMEKGRILYEQKKYTDAVAVYNLALKISNSYADTYLGLARCQEALGQKEAAKLNYLRAWGLDKSLTEAKQAADNIH